MEKRTKQEGVAVCVNEVEKWNNVKDLVVSGEIQFSQTLAKMFSKDTLNKIKVELGTAWIEDRYTNKRNEAFYLIDILNNIMTTKDTKFVKPDDFITPRLVRLVSYERLRGDTIGAKFVDSKGFVNRLKFVAVNPDSTYSTLGTERWLDSSSWAFFFDFKKSKLGVGDVLLVQSVSLKHPLNPGVTYKRWIFQLVQKAEPQAVDVQQKEEVEEINITNDDKGDSGLSDW